MKTLILNILAAIAGLLPIFGVKFDLTPEELAQLAGVIATIVAIANQVVHHTKAKKGRATIEALRRAQAAPPPPHHTHVSKGKR